MQDKLGFSFASPCLGKKQVCIKKMGKTTISMYAFRKKTDTANLPFLISISPFEIWHRGRLNRFLLLQSPVVKTPLDTVQSNTVISNGLLPFTRPSYQATMQPKSSIKSKRKSRPFRFLLICAIDLLGKSRSKRKIWPFCLVLYSTLCF